MTEKVTFQLKKLVRDKIYADMLESDQDVDAETLRGSAKKQATLEKVLEEAQELSSGDDTNPADLGSAVIAYARACGYSLEEFLVAVAELEERRGGFNGGHFIHTVTLDADDPWAEYYRKDPEKYPELTQQQGERVIANGKIFELVQTEQKDGRIFEYARRAPGTRLVIHDETEGKILLTREFRYELGEWDYRLPGGKVFDTLDEYADVRESKDDIVEAAQVQAIREAQQEAGVEISKLALYKKSVLGATVEWDLYVFEATEWQFSADGQDLEDGEEIEAELWVTYEEAKQMILRGAMREERIALVLLQWLEERTQRNA